MYCLTIFATNPNLPNMFLPFLRCRRETKREGFKQQTDLLKLVLGKFSYLLRNGCWNPVLNQVGAEYAVKYETNTETIILTKLARLLVQCSTVTTRLLSLTNAHFPIGLRAINDIALFFLKKTRRINHNTIKSGLRNAA